MRASLRIFSDVASPKFRDLEYTPQVSEVRTAECTQYNSWLISGLDETIAQEGSVRQEHLLQKWCANYYAFNAQ